LLPIEYYGTLLKALEGLGLYVPGPGTFITSFLGPALDANVYFDPPAV